MLIVTEEVKNRHAALEPKERHKAQVKEYCDYHLSQALILADNNESPANAERQLGIPLFAATLETKLKQLIPNLHFEYNGFNSRMKAMYLLVPGQEKEYLLAYHSTPMPEYSIFNYKEEEYWDGTEHISRKDFPKSELQANGKWEFDGPRPGFKRIKRPWNEATRGWRTILIKLIQRGLVSPEIIERTFKGSDRASWNAHLGKSVISPF